MHRRVLSGAVLLALLLLAPAARAAEGPPLAETLARARAAHAKGDHKTAVRLLTDLLKKKEGHVEARLLRAEAYLALGRFEKAVDDTYEVSFVDEKNARALYLRGTIFLRSMELDKAIKALQKVAAHPDYKNDVQLHFRLAACFALKGRHTEAIKTLARVLELDPKFMPARVALIEIHQQRGDAEALAQAVADAQRIDPKHPKIVALFEAERQRKEEEVRLRREKEEAERRKKREAADQAIAAVRKAVEDNPDDVAMKFQLAITLREHERYKQSVEAYQAILKQDPKEPLAYVGLAWLYTNALDDLEQAEACARKAADLAPKEHPRHVSCRIQLALTLTKRKKIKEVEALYKKMIAENPTLSVAYNNLAWLYVTQTDRFKEAEPLALKAVELAGADPEDAAPSRDTLAWIYYRTARFEEALKVQKLAMSGMSDSAEGYYHIGMIHYKLKDLPNAKKALEHALKLDAKFPERPEIEATLKAIKAKAAEEPKPEPEPPDEGPEPAGQAPEPAPPPPPEPPRPVTPAPPARP